MRKSNWLIVGVLVVASIFFLWLWYYLSFNLVDNPLDLVLTIVWWAVVIAACLLIRKVERTRQERIRTTYVMADGSLFNPEAGKVLEARAAGDGPADAIQGVLEGLEYGFSRYDAPDPTDEDVEYRWVVRSKSFEVEDDEEGAAEAAEGAVASDAPELHVVKKWEGEVADVKNPDADPIPFQSKEELAALLAA